MRLIINADDLGLSSAVTNSIVTLMDEGLVTSSSILASGPETPALAQSLPRFPGRSFGVHLNLTELRPMSGQQGLGPLLNDQGCFHNVIRQRRLDRPLLQAIHRELCAQVQAVQALGVRVSHLDSHHHIHTIPALFFVIKDVLRTTGVPAVRLSKNLYCRAEKPGLLRRYEKLLFNLALTHFPSCSHADYFTNISGLLEALPWLANTNRCVEVMVHPGARAAEAETALLRSLPKKFKNISLVSYHEL